MICVCVLHTQLKFFLLYFLPSAFRFSYVFFTLFFSLPLLARIAYTLVENDAFATVGTFVTKNGSILAIRCYDSHVVDALLFTCCTLARLYMVRYS